VLRDVRLGGRDGLAEPRRMQMGTARQEIAGHKVQPHLPQGRRRKLSLLEVKGVNVPKEIAIVMPGSSIQAMGDKVLSRSML